MLKQDLMGLVCILMAPTHTFSAVDRQIDTRRDRRSSTGIKLQVGLVQLLSPSLSPR